VAKAPKLAWPVVGAGARFYADQARLGRCDELKQLGARHVGPNLCGLACGIYAMNGKDVLGEIDSDGDNVHGLPLPVNE